MKSALGLSLLLGVSAYSASASAGYGGKMVPRPASDAPALQGAAKVLRQIEPLPTPTASPVKAAVKGPDFKTVRAEIKAYQAVSGTLSPEDAAQKWLALADRFFAAEPTARESHLIYSFAFQQLLQVLPGPSSWGHLENLVQQRNPLQGKSLRDVSLLLMVQVLLDQKPKQEKTLAALEKLLPATAGQRPMRGLPQLRAAIASAQSGQIKAKTSAGGEDVSYDDEYDFSSLDLRGAATYVPDLVTLEGKSRADARLRQLLVTSPKPLYVPLGDETRALAVRLAAGLTPRVKVPQWRLAQSVGAIALYEATLKRFGAPKQSAPLVGEFRNARFYYLLSLVAAGRNKEAVALATTLHKGSQLGQLTNEVLGEMVQAGHGAQLSQFLYGLLSRNPDLPLWTAYVTVAVRSGKPDSMLALVRQQASNQKLKTQRRLEVNDALASALLAADRVPEGVAVLRANIATPKQKGLAVKRMEWATRLAKVGYVAGRQDWMNEGLKTLRGPLDKVNPGDPESSHMFMEEYYKQQSPSLLIGFGLDAAAENDIIAALRPAPTPGPAHEDSDFSDMAEEHNRPYYLRELAGIYHRRGQHQDVLHLLANARDWESNELADILAERDSAGTPIGHMAAAALVSTGKKEEAVTILRSLLAQVGNYDPSFQMFLDLEGPAAVAYFDKLSELDRFEERPLIWKAQALFKQGKLTEAESAARAAIAIDPSDGEMGKGYRMKAYAVLADVLDAGSDKAQARVMRGAVQAIRAAEAADLVNDAGLLSRAIEQYQESLKFFSDAYCIQSRLAVQLAQEGRLKEAEVHYRRAFELMPTSFGRMESHCFGCEGAFSGRQAEGVAESVFKRLLAKTPNKPQVHYLMGYLREQQGRPGEAITNYRMAVALDPDYINAWNKLLAASKKAALAPHVKDQALFNLLRLDPQMRHITPDFSEVSNPGKLWNTLEASYARRPQDLPSRLMPLPGSPDPALKRAAMASRMARYGMADEYSAGLSPYASTMQRNAQYLRNPARAVAKNKVLMALDMLINNKLNNNWSASVAKAEMEAVEQED